MDVGHRGSTRGAVAGPPVHYVPVASLKANDWNPNVMNAMMYAKALESIREFGFIDPILVRTVDGAYEIIDGEHRWQAAADEGLPLVPVWDLGEVSEADARRLTVIMNELRGQSDPGRMADLMTNIASMTDAETLLRSMPFTDEAIKDMVGLSAFEWPTEAEAIPAVEHEPRWVERLYRLPPEAAAILDKAISRAKGGDELEDWRAIELICADFLAN